MEIYYYIPHYVAILLIIIMIIFCIVFIIAPWDQNMKNRKKMFNCIINLGLLHILFLCISLYTMISLNTKQEVRNEKELNSMTKISK